MSNKLHLGCGDDYRHGWINVDFNKEVKADIHCDLTKEVPFKNNSVSEVFMDNVLEHIDDKKYFQFMDTLYDICKDKAIIRIYVPHFTSTCAFKHSAHYLYFGIGTFGIMENKDAKSKERYNRARFNIKKEYLLTLGHNSQFFGFLVPVSKVFNWFFNLGGTRMKLFWEKFNVFGFEEIYYELEVRK